MIFLSRNRAQQMSMRLETKQTAEVINPGLYVHETRSLKRHRLQWIWLEFIRCVCAVSARRAERSYGAVCVHHSIPSFLLLPLFPV